MPEASDVACDRCGASVPLVSRQHARCLYCLHDQPLSPEVARAVREDAALEAKLEHAAGAGERGFATMFRAGLGLQVFLAVTTLLGAVPGFYILFTMSGDDSREGRILTAVYGIAGLSTLAMAALPLMWLRLLKDSKAKVFAALPLARAAIEDGLLVAGCPGCGARLASSGEVAVVCGHCNTQSLLPQPLVEASARRRHRQVIELRLQGEGAVHDASTHAASQWQTKIMPMFVRFNVFLCLLIAAAVIAHHLAP